MAGPIEAQIAALRTAIAAQAGLRATLGDAVVDAAIAALQEKLAALETQLTAPPTQQRKQVTVLFADVSGFTALAESLDAEEVTDVLNDLWQRLDGAITAHGGLIDKHIGDAVMALWSVDEAREDDPARAVRAALALQATLADFRAATGAALAMRVGLNTGPVLLGEIGTTGEFSAIGDTVNLASRLEQAAPVGGILITHNTYRHVRGLFEMMAQPPLPVRGKTEPVQTYVVERARPRTFVAPTRGIEGIQTHMIGRAAELAALQAACQAILDAPGTQMLAIIGEAGVGKSRLLGEFDRWLGAQTGDVTLLRGRAFLEMRHTPYALWRNLFADAYGIRESDSPATVLDRFRAGMAPWLDADRADLVGHLVGFDFAASKAVRNLQGNPSFGRLATAYLTNALRGLAEQPAVLFLEDLHWADARSLALLDHLLAEIRSARLLVIGLARPTLFEDHPDWGATWTRLDLTPLDEADSRTLVADILQKVETVPDDLRDLIVRGAEGNPFYVEELIKMLLDDGVIVRAADAWRVEMARLKIVRVPATLTGVLQARLDGLSDEERAVLQRASVVGRLFWDDTVATLADDTPLSAIEPLLARIDARELVFRHDQSAFEEANEYAFKHAMLRDVTYETVLLKLRRRYHAGVARWLEAHAGERRNEYLSLIAGHYELAGEHTQASDYFHRSGQMLYRMRAYKDAVPLLERALALTPEDVSTQRALKLAELGSCYGQLSDFDRAQGYLAEGLKLARASDARQVEVIALKGLGRTAQKQGNHDVALEYLEEGLTLAREMGDRRQEASLLSFMGQTYHTQGKPEQARQCHERGLEINRQDGTLLDMAITLNDLGNLAAGNSDFPAARTYYEESLALRRQLGDRWGMGSNLGNLGAIAWEQGDYDTAERHMLEAMTVFRDVGNRLGLANSLSNLGAIALDRDVAYDVVQQRYEEALAIFRAVGHRLGIAASLLNLGKLAYLKDNLPEARAHYEEALAINREIGHQYAEALCLSNLGGIACRQGHYDLAREHQEASLAIRQAIGDRTGICYSLLHLGDVATAMQQDEAAWSLIKEALTEAQAISYPPLFLETIGSAAELLVRRGDQGRALAWLGSALASPLLRRETRHEIDLILARLREQMPADELDAALARGETLDLETIVAAILAEGYA